MFAVWNYDEAKVQVLEITKGQIMTAIKAFVDRKHCGDPKNYDIAVSRSGTGFDTEYVVQGIPPKPLDEKIAKEYGKLKINLEALFTNEDPFGSTPRIPTEDAGYEEPRIQVDRPIPAPVGNDSGTAAFVPGRLKTIPPAFRPKA